jgi:hypothetical protein
VLLLPGVCCIGGIRSRTPMLLFRPFGLEGAARSSFSLIDIKWLWIHDESRKKRISLGRRGGLAKGGLNLCAVEGLAWYFGLRSSGMEVGAAAHVKFGVLPFKVKTQGLALTGCAWQCHCWRHCFESEDYLQGENLRSWIGRRQRWCTVPFLEASLLKSLIFRCCLGGGCITVARAVIL